MWQFLKKKILTLKQIAGLEIVFLPDDKLLLNLVSLKLKDGNIIKEFESYNLSGIEQLKEKLSPSVPITLVINGKGILQKKIDGNFSIDQDFDMRKLLPNLNPKDFFQQVDSFSTFNVASLMRYELLQSTFEKFREQGYKVLSISLGFSSIKTILPLLTDKKPSILETACQNVTITEDGIINYEPVDPVLSKEIPKTEYNLGNQYVRSNGLISFGAALNLFSNTVDNIQETNFIALKKEKVEYKNFLFFKAAAWGLLIFLATILLINFFVYTHFYNKNKDILSIQQNSAEEVDQTKNLQSRINLKENFIQNSGWLKNSRLSFFADRIAAAVPDDILLTTMNIQPLASGSLTENGELAFKKDTILITGTCNNALELNNFINKIKGIPEIKKATVINYSNKKENENSLFSLEILTND